MMKCRMGILYHRWSGVSNISLNPDWTSERVSQWYIGVTHQFVVAWFQVGSFDHVNSMVKTHEP